MQSFPKIVQALHLFISYLTTKSCDLYILRFSAGGRVLEVFTTQPSATYYTAYFLDCPNGKGGAKYGRYSAICPFTQSFIDSPNQVGCYQGVVAFHGCNLFGKDN